MLESNEVVGQSTGKSASKILVMKYKDRKLIVDSNSRQDDMSANSTLLHSENTSPKEPVERRKNEAGGGALSQMIQVGVGGNGMVTTCSPDGGPKRNISSGIQLLSEVARPATITSVPTYFEPAGTVYFSKSSIKSDLLIPNFVAACIAEQDRQAANSRT